MFLCHREDSCFLMDCGEATASQMIRIFGLEQANKILRSLGGVYVSHLHADHHVGLVGVVLARLAAFKEAGVEASKLIVLLPLPVIPFISVSMRQFLLPTCVNIFSTCRLTAGLMRILATMCTL
jgi:ribonuclease Z